MDLDTSNRADLLIAVEDNKLELQGIPFWDSCDELRNSGFKKMVRTDADVVICLNMKNNLLRA